MYRNYCVLPASNLNYCYTAIPFGNHNFIYKRYLLATEGRFRARLVALRVNVAGLT